jgi:hypothetical protein
VAAAEKRLMLKAESPCLLISCVMLSSLGRGPSELGSVTNTVIRSVRFGRPVPVARALGRTTHAR